MQQRVKELRGLAGNIGSYGARQTINLKDLAQPEIFDRFVAIFRDLQSLNPEKYRARITREVAAELAKLLRWLQYGSVSQRLKSPLLLQSPPSRTKTSHNICLTEPYWRWLDQNAQSSESTVSVRLQSLAR